MGRPSYRTQNVRLKTFHIVEGECTMRFPDGGEAVLTPGMLATITGGSFYRLHNTGDVTLAMIGTRSGSMEATVKVEHGTGRIINERASRTASASWFELRWAVEE